MFFIEIEFGPESDADRIGCYIIYHIVYARPFIGTYIY
jgi:hypothetical protein